MSEKQLERMKQLIEEKNKKNQQNQKLKPDRKLGSTHREVMNVKHGGSNNKV